LPIQFGIKVTFVEAPGKLVMRWMPLLVLVVAGLLIGVSVGYLVWSPGAANYGVVSESNEATRTVKVGDVTATFPSVTICKAGGDSSITIGLTNLRGYPLYVAVSLALSSNNGIDTATVSTLTSSPYTITLASYGTASDILNIKPSSTGYAFFDLMVNGQLAGTIALYSVPS
jgi:hypothetical protein